MPRPSKRRLQCRAANAKYCEIVCERKKNYNNTNTNISDPSVYSVNSTESRCQQGFVTPTKNVRDSCGQTQICYSPSTPQRRGGPLLQKLSPIKPYMMGKKAEVDYIPGDEISSHWDVTAPSRDRPTTVSVLIQEDGNVDPLDTSCPVVPNIPSLDGNRVMDLKLLVEFILKFPCPKCLTQDSLTFVSETTNKTMTVTFMFMCRACHCSRSLRDSNCIKTSSSKDYVSENKYKLVGSSLENNHNLEATNEWLDGFDVPLLSYHMWGRCQMLWQESISLTVEQDPLTLLDDNNELDDSQQNHNSQQAQGVQPDSEQEQVLDGTADASDDLLVEMTDVMTVSVSEEETMHHDLKPILNLDIVKKEEPLDYSDVEDAKMSQILEVASLIKNIYLNNSASGKFQSFGCTQCDFITLDCDKMMKHITSHSDQVNGAASWIDEGNELIKSNENYYISTSLGHFEITETTETSNVKLNRNNVELENTKFENEYSESIDNTKDIDNKIKTIPNTIRKQKILKRKNSDASPSTATSSQSQTSHDETLIGTKQKVRKIRKKRSDIWKTFEYALKDDKSLDHDRVRCKQCNYTIYRRDTSTNAMVAHRNTKHSMHPASEKTTCREKNT